MIALNGNKTIITKKKDVGYKLISGSVLVFVTCTDDNGKNLRRKLLIAEVDRKGIVIPSLCYRQKFIFDEKESNWNFEIKPLTPSQLDTVEDKDRRAKEFFCEKYNIEEMDLYGFDEACVEWYRYQDTLDAAKILGTEYKDKMITKGNQQLIYDVFANRKKASSFDMSHPLYGAVKTICNYQKIECPDLTIIRKSCGENYSVDDIARVGGFVARKIFLDKDWYKKDIGPIMGYLKDNDSPVAIIPKRGSYTVYDATKCIYYDLTKEVIDNISLNALMFYRPFPKKAIELIDIIKFALGDFHIGDFIIILAMTALTTIIGLLIPTLNQYIYDLFIPIGDVKGLFELCMVVASCGIGSIAFTIVQSISNIRCFNRMKYSLQAASFDRLFNLPENEIKKFDSADIATRVMYINVVFDAAQRSILMPFVSLIISIPYLVKMFTYSQNMAIAALIILLVYIVFVGILGYIRNKYNIKQMDISNKMRSTINQLLSGISKIRIAGAEVRAMDIYFGEYVDSARTKSKASTVLNINTIISTALPSICLVVFYYFIVKENNINALGDYMAFMSAQSAFSSACIAFITSTLSFGQYTPMCKKIGEILKVEPEISESNIVPGEIDGNINIESVSFSYDKKTEILKNININIKKGEYVAIVGTSGCGKSTLLKLLLGFEKPDSGKIYYDDKDLSTIDKRELRKQFGVVLQNGALIVGTIRDNLTLTAPNATQDDIDRVLKKVGLDNDVAALPMGLNTPLSEGSGGISGGQKQRVLIARAIMNNPKILFFDEATSALDNRSQELVVNSLAEFNCTRIVVAHRLSTIINCDRIIVMKDGEIVEEGNYNTLMSRKSVFYNLVQRQTE